MCHWVSNQRQLFVKQFVKFNGYKIQKVNKGMPYTGLLLGFWQYSLQWHDMCVISSQIHYDDVIMTTMAAQITSLRVVYSTVYSHANQRKHQHSASLAFVWGIHRDRWIPRTKGQLRGKCFHLMTSSCQRRFFVKQLVKVNGYKIQKVVINGPLWGESIDG